MKINPNDDVVRGAAVSSMPSREGTAPVGSPETAPTDQFKSGTAQGPVALQGSSAGVASLKQSPVHEVLAAAPGKDPFKDPWTGPHGGLPNFDTVKVDRFKPALETAMAEKLREIDAIANNPAPATFENTIAAMENSGRMLDRVSTLFYLWSSNLNSPEFQALEEEMAPKLAAFWDSITQNRKLFDRIATVYEGSKTQKLTPEQQRLVWVHHNNFVRSGASLDGPAKARLSEINQRLASLYTRFSKNILADEQGWVTFIDNPADLAGLPESVKSGMAKDAEEKGQPGKWAVTNTRSSVEPFLTHSTRRDLREKVWKNFVNRGDNRDANDTNETISEILKLRVERAKLLGYETHAHWRIADQMAKTPEQAMALMEKVWPPAVARAKEEVADMQALADKEGAKIKIAPWDYRYYAEKVRKAKFDVDESETTPYLQLDKLREGLFFVAAKNFDMHFTPVKGASVYHPDVSVYEVRNGKGDLVGTWYFDPYKRDGKRSGAWMNSYRNQERFDGEQTTIVSNNANFVKGAEGQPTLISWDDAQTLFHEFGHALHGLASNVTYPTLSGTNVSRDYVEFPSQLLEAWLSTSEVLNQFAIHYKTGKPMPHALIEKIERASRFNQGFGTVEYLSSALVDLKLHLAGDKVGDPREFERNTLAALGMPPEIVMRHRTPHFQHVFADDGYSAGYWSYLWSEVHSADATEAFEEATGLYDKTVAKRLYDHVFSVGNTVDPADGYKAFRGRPAEPGALMRSRGFPDKEQTSSSR